MALRYVSRRVGVPALRRALGPRLSPSVGSGPLASRSSQVAYSNGDAAQKMKGSLGSSLMEEKDALGKDEVAKIKASFQATIDAIERSRRREKLQRRLDIGSAVVGVSLGMYIISCIPREAIERAMRKPS